MFKKLGAHGWSPHLPIPRTGPEWPTYHKNMGSVIILKNYLGWCTTMQTFTPSRASRRRALSSKLEEELSNPEVGSSKINNEGSITISKPTLTRFFCPPEIPRFSTVPTRESLTFCNPRDSITLSTTKTFSAFERSAGSLHMMGKNEVHSQ